MTGPVDRGRRGSARSRRLCDGCRAVVGWPDANRWRTLSPVGAGPYDADRFDASQPPRRGRDIEIAEHLVNEPPPELLDGAIAVGGARRAKAGELILDERLDVSSVDRGHSPWHSAIG